VAAMIFWQPLFGRKDRLAAFGSRLAATSGAEAIL